MNVLKMSGALLVVSGVFLMFLGSAIIPVNAQVWGEVVVEEVTDCAAGCANCGNPELQEDGEYICLRGDDTNGTCNTLGLACTLCAGGCEAVDDGSQIDSFNCVCKIVGN